MSNAHSAFNSSGRLSDHILVIKSCERLYPQNTIGFIALNSLLSIVSIHLHSL